MILDSELDQMRERLAVTARGDYAAADVAKAMRECGLVVSDSRVLAALEALRRNSIGAGVLDDLLTLPGVTDVLVNGPDEVFIDRGAGLEQMPMRFVDDEQVRRLAARLASGVGRRLDDASPFVDGRLADGTRLHAVLAPVSEPGTCISLRVPARRNFSLEDCVQSGSLPVEGADLLRSMVAARVAYLISGGTGSGKTTLLSALLSEVPPTERLVIVEDSRELWPSHPHCVCLEGRPPNAEGVGGISLTVLVRQALRMRPDRVVLGEVRGAELCDLLSALNTGHEGGCGTVHANSVHDVPARLEALAALGGMSRDTCHAQVAAAFKVAMHVRREASGRRYVEQLGVFRRLAGGEMFIEDAVTFTADGLRWGPAAEELKGLLS